MMLMIFMTLLAVAAIVTVFARSNDMEKRMSDEQLDAAIQRATDALRLAQSKALPTAGDYEHALWVLAYERERRLTSRPRPHQAH